VGWQDHRVDAPRPSVTPTAGIPPVPAASSNFAQRWTHAQERDVFGVARGEYAVGGGAQLWAAVGVRSGTEYNVLGNPRSDAAGNTTTFRFDNYRRDLVATGEIGARVPFRTGGVKHSISASGAIFDLNSENAFGFSSLTGFAGNLYDPIDVAPPAANVRTGGVLFSPLTTNTIKTSSGALADVLSVAEGRALLTVGARYQVIRQYSYDYNTGDKTTPGYDKNAVTPVVGLAVKPVKPLLLYANYIQALTQGAVAPPMVGSVVVSNSGEVFSPFRSVQYEIGAKYDRGDVVSTLAVFRIAEPSALLDGDVYRQEGEQRNQGIELNLFGEPWAGVRVLGGVTFLDARMTRTQNGTNNGNRVIGVPKEQVNAGVDWDLRAVHGLTLGGRIVYTGSQVADGGNTRSIPPWARLDLDAHYGLPLTGYRLLVRANVVNVTNQDYWASVGGTPGGTYLVLGEPRTFVVSLSVEF
jgi:iron complex outermembrane receptor protein